MPGRTWTVYKLGFLDGAEYVGITGLKDINDRIRKHMNTPCNSELARRLSAGEKCAVDILHDGVSDSDIYELERAEVAKLDKPINIKLTNGRTPDWNQPAAYSTVYRTVHRRYRKRNVVPPRQGNYRCSKCRVVKPWIDFNRDRSRFNGLHSRCKACTRAIARNMNRTVRPGRYRCSGCREVKTQNEFHRNRSRWNGLHTYCKDCSKEYKRLKRLKRFGYPVKPGMYECTRCKQTKPHTEFVRCKRNLSGLRKCCKPCRNQEIQATRATYPVTPGMHECKRCKQTKPHTEFVRDRYQETGLRRECKPCWTTYTVEKRRLLTARKRRQSSRQ